MRDQLASDSCLTYTPTTSLPLSLSQNTELAQTYDTEQTSKKLASIRLHRCFYEDTGKYSNTLFRIHRSILCYIVYCIFMSSYNTQLTTLTFSLDNDGFWRKCWILIQIRRLADCPTADWLCWNQIDLSRKLDDLNFTLEFTVRTLPFHTGLCYVEPGQS